MVTFGPWMVSSLFLGTSWAVHISVGVCHRILCCSLLRRRVLPVGGALSEAASAWSAVLAAPHVHLHFLSEVLVAQELRVGLIISQISR